MLSGPVALEDPHPPSHSMPDFINMSPTASITGTMRRDRVDVAPQLARYLCPGHHIVPLPVQTERSYAHTGLQGYRADKFDLLEAHSEVRGV